MSLKVVNPIDVTEAVLTASGIPEPDASVGEALWQDEASRNITYTLNATSDNAVRHNMTRNNYGELLIVFKNASNQWGVAKFDTNNALVWEQVFNTDTGIANESLKSVGCGIEGDAMILYWMTNLPSGDPNHKKVYEQRISNIAGQGSFPLSYTSSAIELANIPAKIVDSTHIRLTRSNELIFSCYSSNNSGFLAEVNISRLSLNGSEQSFAGTEISTGNVRAITADFNGGAYVSIDGDYSDGKLNIIHYSAALAKESSGKVVYGFGKISQLSFYNGVIDVGIPPGGGLNQLDITPYSQTYTNLGAYKKGDEVILTDTHRIYRCIVNETFSNPKDTTTGDAAAEWIDIGSTNKWKMFNGIRQTKTTSTGQFTVTLEPVTYVNTLAALAISGVTSIRVEVDNTGGTTIYDKTFTTSDFSAIYDHYTYVFYQIAAQKRLVIEDLPPLPNSTIRVTFNGSNIAVGELVHGFAINVGELVAEGTKNDRFRFREQAFDDFGYPTGPKPITVELNTYDVLVPKLNNPAIQSLLDEITGENTLWIGDIGGGQSLVTYGFFERSPIPFDMPNDINYQITVRASV